MQNSGTNYLNGTNKQQDDPPELWKYVVGYEGLYMVSNKGRVKRTGGGRGAKVGKILKLSYATNGYSQVTLSKNCVEKIFRVHRLVAEAFIERVNGKDFVNHKNGDKTDNRVENLEWCTKSENSLHSYRVLGYKQPKMSPSIHAKKIDAATAEEIRSAVGTYAEIARKYGLSDVMVRNIKIGKSWKEATTCQSTQ